MRHASLVLALTLSGAVVASDAAEIENAAEPALVIGSDGLGLVAYQDTANLDLKVAHCVDADCTAVTTVTVDSAGDVGSRAAIAWQAGGLPVISYADVTNNAIKLAFCADTVCASATTVVIESGVTPGGTGHTGVAIGGDGLPLVAYSTGPAIGNGTLRVAHCENGGCTQRTISSLAGAFGETTLAIAGDGRGVFVHRRRTEDVDVDFRHCNDLPCTSATVGGSTLASGPESEGLRRRGEVPTLHDERGASLAVGPDGLPIYIFNSVFISPSAGFHVVRCLDFRCFTFVDTRSIVGVGGLSSTAIDAVGRPRLALGMYPAAILLECNDAACTTHQQVCVAPWADRPSLALHASGAPLVAAERNADVVVVPAAGCQPTINTADVSVAEYNPPVSIVMQFPVRLGPPAATPVTVAYQTVDVTAQAGLDYVGVSGVLTFDPGQTDQAVLVSVIADTIVEPDETFRVVLSSPSGTPFAQDVATGVIVNDDQPPPPPQPTVDVADCAVTEGNVGVTGCTFDVRLSFTYPGEVTVAYATSDATASAGSDYIAQFGTLTFAAGTTSQTISVSVVGDLVGEPNESFTLILSSPVNAVPGDMNAAGNIVDDDWPVLPGLELTHGSALVADFQPDPGPAADRDDYRVSQAPFSSYEAVLDGVSGDAAPGVRVEWIAADGTTVLGNGQPVGTGPAQSLRFANPIGLPVTTQYVRVRGASCGTSCGPDDTYRLRLYETTGRIPRFNNSGSQTTVLILQNRTGSNVLAEAHFWGTGGQPLRSQGLLVQPRGTMAISTANLGLAGLAGSITVTHNGPYGALAGKAVALEPSTGFSFDSPMEVKLR